MYGLCVVVHMMLHNSYMEIEKKASPDGTFFYQPKSHFKRFVCPFPLKCLVRCCFIVAQRNLCVLLVYGLQVLER